MTIARWGFRLVPVALVAALVGCGGGGGGGSGGSGGPGDNPGSGGGGTGGGATVDNTPTTPEPRRLVVTQDFWIPSGFFADYRVFIDGRGVAFIAGAGGRQSVATTPVSGTALGRIDGLPPVASVVVDSKSRAFALTTQGEVWAWGRNFNHLFRPGDLSAYQLTPTRLAAWGTAKDVQDCAGSFPVLLLLKADGSLRHSPASFVQYGSQAATDLASIPGVTSIRSISRGIYGAGDCSFYAVGTAGGVQQINMRRTVSGSTETYSANVVPVSGLPPIREIACGPTHCLARANDGSAWAWGENSDGQLGDGTATARLVPVQVVLGAGSFRKLVVQHQLFGASIAVTNNGGTRIWGHFPHYVMDQLRNAGVPLVNGGRGVATPTQYWADGSGIEDIELSYGTSGGSDGSMRLSDGRVLVWGGNSDGQLGDGARGTSTPQTAPIEVPGLNLN